MAEIHKEERSKEEILLLEDIKSLLEDIKGYIKESKEIEKEMLKKKKERAEAREKRKFVPPTLSEVEAFCEEKNLNHVDPQTFFSYYSANKWRISKTGAKMTSWEAAIISWNARSKDSEAKNAKATKNFFDELANSHEDDPMDWGTV